MQIDIKYVSLQAPISYIATLMKHLLAICFFAVTLFSLTGCETPPKGNARLLDFLQDGKTTREAVYLQLGEPSGVFEAGRILTYRLAEDKGGYLLLLQPRIGWTGLYSLVLSFDAAGTLTRHSLVKVRAE